jgi:hypothetical protein
MSSATSTETLRRPTDDPRGGADAGIDPATGGLRPWHVFLIGALLAATASVLLATDNSPENLVLVSLSVVTAGLAGVALHRTLWPLVAPETDHATAPLGGRARIALEREKALVLRSIKELEFDRAMGKVADADFQDMVARLRARAIGLMKQLDEQRPGYRSLIEREIGQRLRAHGTAPSTGRIAGNAKVAAVLACASCGTRNDGDAKFCKTCGRRLA